MNRIENMHLIKTYLSRFETYVRLSNINNEYDINKHAENFLIPLLNLVFGWDLVSLNEEHKNAKSLDLYEAKRKIGIQVTSDTSIEKIKTTLFGFTSSRYKNKVNQIIFYFIKTKQKRYSEEGIRKIIGKKIKFKISDNVIDNEDLYFKISNLKEDSKIVDILKLLSNEFSDFRLKDNFSISDYEDFREKYKQCCLNNYSRLNFFGLSVPRKPREIELYSLFVRPNFSTKIDKIYKYDASEDPESNLFDVSAGRVESLTKIYYSTFIDKFSNNFEFKRLFNLGNHVGILGDPGAGKSSLVKFSICKIISNDKSIFENDDIYYYLPIRIELHKYNRFRFDKHLGILEYIAYNLIDEFQLQIAKAQLEYFIKNFPILVFFDGLDEIFDIQERIAVRNDIENFVQNHKISKSIVTCRYESYEEVQLKKETYNIINVEDFDEYQIEDYVKKWYDIEESHGFVREQEIKNCLDQLKVVNDELKKNPLLLSLILILYRNEQDLPTSKLEIYESCAQTLVETRDTKEKKLDFKLKVSNKISVFANLAYWQFSTEVNKEVSKINYSAVKNFIANHLTSKGEFDEYESAEEAAKQFLEYAKIRSLYFENKFTHKTFYEYFTSYYIYINYYAKPGKRSDLEILIVKNIGIASWHVILELLLSKIDQNQIDFEIIDSIVSELLIKKPEETTYFFSSLLKHLRNISPSKYKILIEKIIFFLTDQNYIRKSDKIVLRNYFENLGSLIQIKRYLDAFLKIIDNKLLQNEDTFETLHYLLYELNKVYKIKELKNFLSETHYSKTRNNLLICKIFLLTHFDEISEKNKALKLFDTFYHRFGEEKIYETFSSDYGQAIFLGNNSFNWIVYLFNQCKTKEDADTLNNKLKTFKISQQSIEKTLIENVTLFSPIFETIHMLKDYLSKTKSTDPIYSFYLLINKLSVSRFKDEYQFMRLKFD